MSAAFLILFTLSFIGAIGWMSREDCLGGNPKKHVVLGVFSVIIVVFFIVVYPRG